VVVVVFEAGEGRLWSAGAGFVGEPDAVIAEDPAMSVGAYTRP